MLQLAAAAASRAAAALLGALRGGYNLVRLLPCLAGQPPPGLLLNGLLRGGPVRRVGRALQLAALSAALRRAS